MNSTASPMAGTMPREHFPAGRPPLAVALPHPPWPPPPVAQPRLQGRLIPGRRWHGSPPLVPRCAPRRSSPRTDLASRHRGGPPPPRPRRADRGRGGCLQRWTWRSPCSVNSNPGCLHRRAQNGGSQVVGAGPSGCLGARTDHKGLCGTVPLKPGKGNDLLRGASREADGPRIAVQPMCLKGRSLVSLRAFGPGKSCS
jgi:hypothetical protein